ncbi:hypothetical protein B0H67DRAFT_221784 [Lasiosphaeris hirsuta]|uniref:Uncharacterized protein n=1 Tax=Lasiosphaeris hirsuta TaxID=260670 RepID=A0AA40AF83_9PEZI|nr:hypothetical protein B0H67DRAFT_221784 [Lasiosphaeris hirsuta]
MGPTQGYLAREGATDTPPVPDQYDPHQPAETGLTPAPPLVLVSEPKQQPVDEISGSNLHCVQQFEACESDCPMVWFCRACNVTYCDQCWSGQLVHRKKLNKPGAVVHKINLEVAGKVGNVLTPPTDERMREELHRGDESTAWFGIERLG